MVDYRIKLCEAILLLKYIISVMTFRNLLSQRKIVEI